ncbi:hypothetical protein [Mucilaginibacter sp. dw_454]|uniref:hypothetical protein n=1 Tax=Mucilaginibacter sp. dw_454 TaxID=2720079 RepID=UPI001BD33CEF|nr:hypothetical protein [Mucilaginibacter sp. dw_454]
MENVDNIFDKEAQLKQIKERGLDSYLDRDLKEFYQKFERLKELVSTEADNEHFEEAYDLFCHIFDAVPIMLHKLYGMNVIRAARNKLGEIFTTQERISYNKETAHIGPGKFNVWYQSMFYGCLPYIPTNKGLYPEPRLVAALECCKDLHRAGVELLIQDVTIGAWKIVEPFIAVNFAFDPVHLSNNPEMKSATENFLLDMSKGYSNEAMDFIREVYEYFSCLCRTGSDERSYYVLTALYLAIKEYYKKMLNTDVLALISSSAASEGYGLNIVMTPEAVDRHLKLKMVMMERFHLETIGSTNYIALPITEIITNSNDVENFHYHFEKYLPLPDHILVEFKGADYGYLPQ